MKTSQQLRDLRKRRYALKQYALKLPGLRDRALKYHSTRIRLMSDDELHSRIELLNHEIKELELIERHNQQNESH